MDVRKFDNRADYVFFTDYDVLLFNSLSALSHGGAFDTKIISDKPFTCELRNAEDKQLFGVFFLSLLGGGKVCIAFENRKSGAAAWADFMRKELGEEPAPTKDNLRTAIKSYFHALRGLGIDLHKRPALIVDAIKDKPKQNRNTQKRAVIWRDIRPWILSAKVRPTAKECIAEIRKKQGYKEKQISRQRMSAILSEGLSGMYDEILENL